MESRLFLFFVDRDGLQVFGFKNFAAIQAFEVLDSVASGNHLCTGMFASGLHNSV